MSVKSLSLVLASATEFLIQLEAYSIVLVTYFGKQGPLSVLWVVGVVDTKEAV